MLLDRANREAATRGAAKILGNRSILCALRVLFFRLLRELLGRSAGAPFGMRRCRAVFIRPDRAAVLPNVRSGGKILICFCRSSSSGREEMSCRMQP